MRWFPWTLRALWAVLPVLGWAGLPGAAVVLLWAGWAVGLVAVLVPHPIGLTFVRVAVPLGFALAVWSGDWLGVALVGLAVVAVFAPPTGVLFVNGPAYPNERRFPLRAPGPLLAGLLLVAWGLCVGPLFFGVLALGDGRVLVGVGLVSVGVPLAVVLGRSLHTLSRRWVVFVPAGVVLHDPLALADPVLFERKKVEALRLAPADTDSLDLTQRSPGLAVELVLTEKVPMTLMRPGNRAGEPGASARLLFTPTRPGAVLAEARTRRLPG